MELIAEVSADIEEALPVAERSTSLDSRLVVDSFNEQIDKMKRIVKENEESLEFAPSPVMPVNIPKTKQSEEKPKE